MVKDRSVVPRKLFYSPMCISPLLALYKQFVTIHNAVQHRHLLVSFLWEGHVPSIVSSCQGAATLGDRKAVLPMRTAILLLLASFPEGQAPPLLLTRCGIFLGNGQQHLRPLGVRSTLCQAVAT